MSDLDFNLKRDNGDTFRAFGSAEGVSVEITKPWSQYVFKLTAEETEGLAVHLKTMASYRMVPAHLAPRNA